jgi:hypothetical protein
MPFTPCVRELTSGLFRPHWTREAVVFLALCLAPMVSSVALARETCGREPIPDWTPQEKWTWERVCAGEIADFNEAKGYGGKLDPLDPEESERFPKNRVLRSAFLVAILLDQPYRAALTRHGVHIKGAWFIDELDLSDAVLAHQLFLIGSRFDEKVTLDNLQTPLRISLAGSAFNRALFLDGVQTARPLWMYNSKFAEVYLRGANVREELDINSSTITGTLDMQGLRVEWFTSQGGRYGKVVLRGATIEGPLNMTGSTFTGTLDMEGLQVGRSLLLKDVTVTTPDQVNLNLAKVGLVLDISGSALPSLNLTGTQILGELWLGSSDRNPVKWRDGAALTLHRTEVGAVHVQDLETAWPDSLELNGFTYAQFSESTAGSTTHVGGRNIAWLKKWLAKQKRYSPQPYEQLASVLLKTGYRDKAEEILYESKERERRESATCWTWLWLGVLKLSIGYGYRIIPYVPGWTLFFTIFGAIVLKWRGHAPAKALECWGIFYSLDMFLPIIRLREYHYTFDLDDRCARFYFYFHKLMGYFFGSLLVAGLTGLVR